jgi:hypothetical protein
LNIFKLTFDCGNIRYILSTTKENVPIPKGIRFTITKITGSTEIKTMKINLKKDDFVYLSE